MNANQQPKNARLGRGLSALLGDYSGAERAISDPSEDSDVANDEGTEVAANTLAVELISPNPKQPRRTFVESDLQELSDSIRLKGVIQPILVRPDPEKDGHYQIIAGERRWRAARRAGLTELPAVIRDMDDREVLEVGIIENVQRADLNPIEEAEAYKSLIDRFGRTQDSVATQVGKSREHVANTMRLLNLPDDVREKVKDGLLTPGHARALLKTENPSDLADEVVSGKLTVRETEKRAKEEKAGGAASYGKPAAADKDVDTKALEADLERSLGLDVDIRHTKKGGEVRIKYATLEQLDEVCRILSRPKIHAREVPAVEAAPSETRIVRAGEDDADDETADA